MTLSTTSAIKIQLTSTLGPARSTTYFTLLNDYISARMSRDEFDEAARQTLDTSHLLQLHNSLIVSLFDFSGHHLRAKMNKGLNDLATVDGEPAEVKPLVFKKRRRILPYQGGHLPDPSNPHQNDDENLDDGQLRSKRLKKWALTLGKRERDRINALPRPPAKKARLDAEIQHERGVRLLTERGSVPGTRMPVAFSSQTRTAMSLQQISDRITLISSQYNLGNPEKNSVELLKDAVVIKLKDILRRAIEITFEPPDLELRSNKSASPEETPIKTLDVRSMANLFTVDPSILPNSSAAVQALLNSRKGVSSSPDNDDILNGSSSMRREDSDPRWQLFALLASRSTVREALKNTEE